MMELRLSDVTLPRPLAIELVEGSERRTEPVEVDYRQDSLPVTAGLYESFLARGKTGQVALGCYLHLLWTYRKQGTDRPWATNQYLQNGLGIGERKVKAAKSLLVKMGLISYVRRQDERGQIVKTYTRLNLLPNPGQSTSANSALVESTGAFTARVASRTGGSGPQMLEEGIKCLKKKVIIRQTSRGTAQSARKLRGPAISFDLETGVFHSIPDEQVRDWHNCYPDVDVDMELARMSSWLKANPGREKKNYGRFIVNWLSRTQERADGKSSKGRPA